MGAQICPSAQQLNQREIKLDQKHKIRIQHPPKIQKLQPIQGIIFLDEGNDLGKERSNSIPKQATLENTSSKPDVSENKNEPQVQQDANLVNALNDFQDLQNNSKDESNSALLEVKHKSILKNKALVGTNPPSPKNQQKDTDSIGSQRSIKKVTFDKKQKVVYSSFRKPKT